jgi:hypothetical protein
VRAERQAVILYDAEEKAKDNRNDGEFGGRIARLPNDDAQTLAGLSISNTHPDYIELMQSIL